MSKYEHYQERLTGWLSDFADKYGKQTNTPTDFKPETKQANHIDNILDIVNRNKKKSIETKVNELRERVGLDLLLNIEKEGAGIENKEASIKKAIPLSCRDKRAQSQDIMMKIKQYVGEVIRNRNGAVATPALFEQLENYLKLDKDWLRENYEVIKDMIDVARQEFSPKQYNTDMPVNELARTDEVKEKEPPVFQQPSPASN